MFYFEWVVLEGRDTPIQFGKTSFEVYFRGRVLLTFRNSRDLFRKGGVVDFLPKKNHVLQQTTGYRHNQHQQPMGAPDSRRDTAHSQPLAAAQGTSRPNSNNSNMSGGDDGADSSILREQRNNDMAVGSAAAGQRSPGDKENAGNTAPRACDLPETICSGFVERYLKQQLAEKVGAFSTNLCKYVFVLTFPFFRK